MPDRLQAAHDAFESRVWAEAYQELSGRDRDTMLAADLERLAVAAYLIGRDGKSAAAWEAAHRRFGDGGDPRSRRAARSGWLSA